jgi:hypothetical protein
MEPKSRGAIDDQGHSASIAVRYSGLMAQDLKFIEFVEFISIPLRSGKSVRHLFVSGLPGLRRRYEPLHVLAHQGVEFGVGHLKPPVLL